MPRRDADNSHRSLEYRTLRASLLHGSMQTDRMGNRIEAAHQSLVTRRRAWLSFIVGQSKLLHFIAACK